MNELSLPKRKPTRIPGYDYASAATYFVTICLQGMERRLGRVENGEVLLSSPGELAHRLWIENARRYDDVLLDAFIVMPNHLHAIVMLGADPGYRPIPTRLDTVVGSFKSLHTVEYGRGVRAGAFPRYTGGLWQRGFYDRILRDERELDIARSYIDGNPGRWTEREQGLR